MKNTLRARVLLIALLVMICCFLPADAAHASVLGEQIDGYDATAAGGVQLSRGIFWTGSDYRTENYLVYDDETDVFLVVVYGSKLLNYGDFPTMAALLTSQGYTVLGGINGDYYNTSDYQPLGLVITEGVLRSSDGGHWAVGFKSDGSVIMGKPNMHMSILIDGTEYGLSAINKTRSADNFVLLTEDYSYTTISSGAGRYAILSIVDGGELSINCSLTLQVEEIIDSSAAIDIEPGQLVLSMAETAGEWRHQAMNSLAPGKTFTLNISSAAGWDEVDYAIGSLHKLVTDGRIESGLDNTAAPRSAVGVKSNGKLVLYTVDGRQSGHSVGASMQDVAARLVELGCVEATLMDGGGSTTLNAIYGGESSLSQINSPSDGKQRSVTNYIMLVSSARGSGSASQLTLYPLSLNILSGADSQFYALAMDKNGLAASVPSRLQYSVSDDIGTINSSGLFTAASGSNKQGTVQVSASGVSSAEVNVQVVANPDKISIKDAASGLELSTLEITAGQSIDLNASAEYRHLQLVCSDSCFLWAVEGDIGSISQDGVFTAANTKGEGKIMIAAGTTSFSLPLTIKRGYTFDDVLPGDWCYEAVEFVAERGLFTGTSDGIFEPRGSMSRAMIVTVLHRMAGSPSGVYSSFSDVADGLWYSEAVSWANIHEIVQGFSDGSFGPNQNVTREQIASILYRYANSIGDVSSSTDLSTYSDSADIHDYAITAMQWAVAEGIISGRPDNTLDPRGTATRAEVATMLMRFLAE